MTKFLIRWAINAIALYVAVQIVPGIQFSGVWTGILWLALIFGLLNALVRPLLKFLTCPLIILTLGLFSILINTALLLLTNARAIVLASASRGRLLAGSTWQFGDQFCKCCHESYPAR